MSVDGVYKVTAYVMSGGSGTGLTSLGRTPVRGRTIAVDPKVIPYDSKVRIQGFDNIFVAEDTGGVIKGRCIDIYFGDDTTNPEFRDQALAFGRRELEVRLVSVGDTTSSGSSTVSDDSTVSRGGGGGRTYNEAMALLAAESGIDTTNISPTSSVPAQQVPTADGKFPSTGNVNAIKTNDRYISEFARVAINYDLQVAGSNGVNVPEVIKNRARNLGNIIVEAEKEISYKYPSSNVNRLYSR